MPARVPILDSSFAAFVLGYTLSLVGVGLICEFSGLQWSWLSYQLVEHRRMDVALGSCIIGLIGMTAAAGIAFGKKWGFVISQLLLIIAVFGVVSGFVKLVSRRMVPGDIFVVAFFALALLGNFYFCRRQPGSA